ncbi:PREDICTED: proline-rich acidic protein 1 [Mandrillus leucophaeus]|uniref:proline-rich acidic protein 1 n=1 Tax=Mandrillus leucophaeus TaxID=9568 RepID=UPI0005F449F2|nr:PREDICTED: proline-rich acidic protein 1 [Mandrillus leucophaeus]
MVRGENSQKIPEYIGARTLRVALQSPELAVLEGPHSTRLEALPPLVSAHEALGGTHTLQPAGSEPPTVAAHWGLSRKRCCHAPLSPPAVAPQLWDTAGARLQHVFTCPHVEGGRKARQNLWSFRANHQCLPQWGPPRLWGAGSGAGAVGSGLSGAGGRVLMVTSLVAVLLWEAGAASAPKVGPTPVTFPIKVHVKHRPSEQEAEKAWGARVVEPPEKDDQLVGLLPVPKPKLLTAEKSPGIKASVETEDILGHVLSPQQGPEPDHDSLHHPPPEEDQGEEGPRLWVMPNRQVLRGPEEDQDHIYHP